MKDAAREVQEEDEQNRQGKRTKTAAPKRANKKQKPEIVTSAGSKPEAAVTAAEPAKVETEVKDPNPGNKNQEVVTPAGSKPEAAVTAEPAKAEAEVKDPLVPSPKKVIKKRGQVSVDDLQTLWKTKEP